MQPISVPAPDGAASILVVAQDMQGWIVQEALGRMCRRFASLDAAMRFASHGRHAFAGAAVAISCAPEAEPR